MIDELERLLAQATPGPWETDEFAINAGDQMVAEAYGGIKYAATNAALIAAAVNALPAFVRLARESERWRNAYESNDPSDDCFDAMCAALEKLEEALL